MHATSPTLFHRLRTRPDGPTWSRFVDLYSPLLYHWLKRAGLQESDCADLMQEVLTLLVRKLPEFEYDAHKSFRAWLYTVTMNQVRNHFKSRKRQPFNQADDALANQAVCDHVGYLEEAEYRSYLINRALTLLQADFKPHTWKAFWQHVVEARPAAEVARELGMTPGAVYTARVRILERLRQELAGLLD
jgi:RNA polymerase sigma-70 factor (ECF subfamily)